MKLVLCVWRLSRTIYVWALFMFSHNYYSHFIDKDVEIQGIKEVVWSHVSANDMTKIFTPADMDKQEIFIIHFCSHHWCHCQIFNFLGFRYPFPECLTVYSLQLRIVPFSGQNHIWRVKLPYNILPGAALSLGENKVVANFVLDPPGCLWTEPNPYLPFLFTLVFLIPLVWVPTTNKSPRVMDSAFLESINLNRPVSTIALHFVIHSDGVLKRQTQPQKLILILLLIFCFSSVVLFCSFSSTWEVKEKTTKISVSNTNTPPHTKNKTNKQKSKTHLSDLPWILLVLASKSGCDLLY